MRIECAGAVIFDEGGRLLVVQRGHEPSKGKWSLPGGRLEVGESAEEAAVREVREETGLDVRITRLAGESEWPDEESTLHILDFVGERIDPTQPARAGDDAADVRWVTLSELLSLETTDGLLDYLTDWGVMPTAP